MRTQSVFVSVSPLFAANHVSAMLSFVEAMCDSFVRQWDDGFPFSLVFIRSEVLLEPWNASPTRLGTRSKEFSIQARLKVLQPYFYHAVAVQAIIVVRLLHPHGCSKHLPKPQKCSFGRHLVLWQQFGC